MREICTSGSVREPAGNRWLYSADRMVFVHGKSVATPNDPKLSDRLQEAAPADREKEQAGAVRGAAPAGAQAAEQPA
jgi:hypothetical protein